MLQAVDPFEPSWRSARPDSSSFLQQLIIGCAFAVSSAVVIAPPYVREELRVALLQVLQYLEITGLSGTCQPYSGDHPEWLLVERQSMLG